MVLVVVVVEVVGFHGWQARSLSCTSLSALGSYFTTHSFTLDTIGRHSLSLRRRNIYHLRSPADPFRAGTAYLRPIHSAVQSQRSRSNTVSFSQWFCSQFKSFSVENKTTNSSTLARRDQSKHPPTAIPVLDVTEIDDKGGSETQNNRNTFDAFLGE